MMLSTRVANEIMEQRLLHTTVLSKNDCVVRDNKTVSFSTIEIHEHAVVLGANPATMCGPPLEIDWYPQSSITVDLDSYEELRPSRRVKQELAIPGGKREEMLIRSGYALNQISSQVIEMKRIQKEREEVVRKFFNRRKFGRSGCKSLEAVIFV